MNKQAKGAVTVVAVILIVAAIWHLTNRSKTTFAKAIVKLGGASNYPVLLTFDEGLLKEWARALAKGKKEFSYNDARYNTVGGTKITS